MSEYLAYSVDITSTTASLLCCTVALMVSIMVKSWRDNDRKRKSKNYPPSPRAMPVIGHLHLLAKYQENPWEGFDTFRQEHGNIVGIQLGNFSAVLVSSSELAREVLLTKGEVFCDRPKFDRYRRIFGNDRQNSLALCDWSDLQRMRRIVAQLGILPRYGSRLHHHLDACIQTDIQPYINHVLKSQLVLEKFDLLYMCSNIFTNYLCSTRFDTSNEAYRETMYNYDYVFFDINNCYSFDFIPSLTTVGIGKSYVDDLVKKCNSLRNYMEKEILAPRAAEYNANGSKNIATENNKQKVRLDEATDGDTVIKRDFLDLSIQHHFENPTNYPWDVNVYEVLDLVGGHSAVGNLLMRALGFLALNPDYQDEIFEEAKTVLERETGLDVDLEHENAFVTLEQQSKMPRTEAAILETLRLASSPIVPHVASKNTTLQNYDIDAGTMVMFNGYHLNMSDKYWTEPKKYNPKRFLVKSGSNNNTDCEYQISKPEYFMPFSCGRRACLGYKMVTHVSFTAIANICLKYKMSPQSADDVAKQLTPKGSLALCPDNTFKLNLEPRFVHDE
ncbi:Cytochrome P450 -like protein [Halotydeus destructor]|nr:Cytochrome P450 -like protein [Halotydeus destructor]